MRNARAPARRLRRLVFSLQPHLPHRPESRARDPRLMHEYLFASIVRYDEPESLGRVEPLHLRSRGASRRVSPAPRRSPAIASAFAFSESTTPPARPSHRRATRRRAIARAVKSSALAVARPSRVRHRRPSSSVLARVRHRARHRQSRHRARLASSSRASRVLRVDDDAHHFYPHRSRASRAHLPARARRHRARWRVDARRNRDERARASCAARVSVCVSSLLRYSWA